MRYLVFILLLLLLLLMAPFTSIGQTGQCLGGGCATGGSQYPGSTLTPTTSWQTQGSIWAGEWQLFNVTSGNIYEFSLCAVDGGSCSYDGQLTLRNNSGLGLLCYSDDYCGDDPKIMWTATFTGVVRTRVNLYSCSTNSTSTTLAYKYTAPVSCTTPGTPGSVVGTTTGSTSANLSWAAGSPVGSATVTYYWVVGTSPSVTYGSGVDQGTTTGTSASTSALICGTTYYLRVYAFTNCNSTSSGYGTSASFTTSDCCTYKEIYSGYSTWGTGTTNCEDPYNSYYTDSRASFIITASELTAASLGAGDLEKIKFYCYETTGQTTSQFSIRLKHIGATTTFSAWDNAGWTQYYGPTTVQPGAGSWFEHIFSTGFTWDGVNNVAIDIYRDDDGYTGTGGMYVKTGMALGKTFAGRNDNYLYADWPGTMTGSQFTHVPAVQICGAAIACATPTTQASSITFSSVGCTSMQINWTNGNGTKRVVKMNTSNSFTSPADGTDPAASTVYGGGQQVIYNNSGNSVTVTGLTAGTTYWYRVFDYNCTGVNTKYQTSTGTNNPNSQATSPLPSAAGGISGTATVCQGQNGVAYSVGAITNATSYGWSYSGAGFSIASGSGTNSITANFSASATSGNLTVWGINACGIGTTSANYSVTVNPLPSAAGGISGTSAVCQSQNGVAFSVGAIANATSYGWSYSGAGFSIASGSGTNSITANFSAVATSGNLTVWGINACGNGTTSANYAVTVTPVPAAAGGISGTSPVCQEQNGVAFSVGAIASATSYVWSYSGTGFSIASGSGTNSITANFSGSATSGNLTVYGTNGCGNGTVSANYAITVNPLPAAAAGISGTSTVCQNQNGVAFSVGAIANASSYGWSYTGAGFSIASGSGTNSITANFSGSATSGDLTVWGINACGTGTTSTNYAITVNPLPSAAGGISGTSTICQGQNGIAFSVGVITNASSYVWSYSGAGFSIASGSGTNSITANFSGSATSGNLTVYGTNACGNGTTSANYAITVEILSNAPTGTSATINPISCPGDATTLNVLGGSLGSGASWIWYTGSCGGTSIGSGVSIGVNPTSSTTYYVRAEGTCNTTSCQSITVTITNAESSAASSATSSDNNIDPGTMVTLDFTGGSLGTGASWEWYSGSCGGTSVGSGLSVDVYPTTTTTYYVRAEGGCNTTGCVSVTVVVNGAFSLNNYGANIFIENNTYLYIYESGGGNYLNTSGSGSNGEVENEGVIKLQGDWINNAQNGVFITNEGSVELMGADQNISGSDSTYFNNLTLLGSGTKTLNINTWVGGGFASPSGILDLDTRILNLNGNRLTITNPGTNGIDASGGGHILCESPDESSKIQWNVRNNTGSYVYPFGNAASVRISFTFNITSGGTESSLGNVVLLTYPTGSPNTPYPAGVLNVNGLDGTDNSENVVNRFWRISPNDYTTIPTADITFSYPEADLDGIAESDLQAQRWDGSIWELDPVGVVNTGANTVTVSGVSSFSPWVLVNFKQPLPIELLSFDAYCNNGVVDLQWVTASETNNDFFTLEKSPDADNYSSLTIIPGAGSSSARLQYSFEDRYPFDGETYYRLKQTDFNGRFSYSETITALCDETDDFELVNIYPISGRNDGSINMDVKSGRELGFTVSFYDARGRRLIKNFYTSEIGNNLIQIDIGSLSEGIYLIVLQNDSKTITRKIVLN